MLRKTHFFFLSLALGAALSAQATLTPGTGYSVTQVLSGTGISAFDVYESGGETYAYGWAGGTLKRYSVTNNTQVADLGAPDGYSGYISYVEYNPVTGSTWVGFSTYSGADDRIYEVDAGGNWTLRTTLSFNYSMAFSGTEVFVMSGNTVYWLDNSDGYSPVAVVEAGNYSGGIGFDGSDLVLLTNGLSTDSLLTFTGTQLADAISGSSILYIGDAASDTPVTFSGGAVTVGADGTIYYSTNDYVSYEFSGIYDENGNLIASTDDSYYDAISVLDAEGDLLYVGTWSADGIYILTAVPEPCTYALLSGVAVLAFSLYRRRKLG